MKTSDSRIYLDVTSSCQSALNTGVKRMQRGLHTWLSRYENYHPVYWQSVRRSYRHLAGSDRIVLEQTNERNLEGLELYDAFGGGLFSDFKHWRRDALVELAWPGELKAGDVLLVPDLLWDNRAHFFRKIKACPAIKVGIFHDAIGLRRAWKSGIDAVFCAKGVKALAAFDLVICISKEAEADLLHYWKKFGLAPARTHVALWPVPFGGAKPAQQGSFESGELLYVARLEEHKNHLRLLDACDQLWKRGESFRLSLIGCNAYPFYSWKVRKRVAELKAQGRAVELRAQVSETELHEAYRQCSFTVFPSLLEGFGLPIIESLWHGRPVVCGNKGALGEVALGGGCEITDPMDTGAMAASIQKLLNDETHYRKLHEEIQRRPFRTWSDYWQDISLPLNEMKSAIVNC